MKDHQEGQSDDLHSKQSGQLSTVFSYDSPQTTFHLLVSEPTQWTQLTERPLSLLVKKTCDSLLLFSVIAQPFSFASPQQPSQSMCARLELEVLTFKAGKHFL